LSYKAQVTWPIRLCHIDSFFVILNFKKKIKIKLRSFEKNEKKNKKNTKLLKNP
ncbi:unnamed protein product, partial [Arabidopsis halleri]